MKKARLVALLFAAGAALFAQSPPNWDRWQFLMGDWIGEGTGQPGAGEGGFSFRPALDGRVLVRKNEAHYAATKDRPAFSHEDLMVVYPEGTAARAVYFDSEGHVIQYGVEFSAAGERITFISGAEPSATRYRLTYTKLAAEKVGIRFEMAPPGKPEAFAPYIEATARRK